MFLFPFPIIVTSMRSAEWVTITSIWQGKKSRLTGSGESQDYRTKPGSRPRIILSTVLDKARHPTPVFLPGEAHGQRSLAGYSPWGRRELDIAEAT